MQIYKDRKHAGQVLAELLAEYAGRSDVHVLGLPRGGVPVAFEVAKALRAPLDVLLVRKLGVPGQPEVAMGAIAAGDVLVLNPDLVTALNISESAVQHVAEREREVIRQKEQLYRGERPAPDLKGRVVILIDDGLATGSTMRAAIIALRRQQPRQIIVAVPTAPGNACDIFCEQVDDVVCPSMPEPFRAISLSYRDFGQVSDEEVRRLLDESQVYQHKGESKTTSEVHPMDNRDIERTNEAVIRP